MRPLLYHLTQHLLAPGSGARIRNRVQALLDYQKLKGDHFLDVGCGPKSLLAQQAIHPVGLEACPAFVESLRRSGNEAVLGSAAHLPFAGDAFDAVFSFGLLHHLADDLASQAILEMKRVTKSGGLTVIFDSVLPLSSVQRPIARMIRALDRGKYVRTEEQLRELLSNSQKGCHFERFTYAWTGLEGLFSWQLKSAVLKKAEDNAHRF